MSLELVHKEEKTLLDVRNADELITEGSIQEAVHIPMPIVPSRLEEIKSLTIPILVFCKVGGRAQQVVDFLKQNGIEDVHNVLGYSDVITEMNK